MPRPAVLQRNAMVMIIRIHKRNVDNHSSTFFEDPIVSVNEFAQISCTELSSSLACEKDKWKRAVQAILDAVNTHLKEKYDRVFRNSSWPRSKKPVRLAEYACVMMEEEISSMLDDAFSRNSSLLRDVTNPLISRAIKEEIAVDLKELASEKGIKEDTFSEDIDELRIDELTADEMERVVRSFSSRHPLSWVSLKDVWSAFATRGLSHQLPFHEREYTFIIKLMTQGSNWGEMETHNIPIKMKMQPVNLTSDEEAINKFVESVVCLKPGETPKSRISKDDLKQAGIPLSMGPRVKEVYQEMSANGKGAAAVLKDNNFRVLHDDVQLVTYENSMEMWHRLQFALLRNRDELPNDLRGG